MIFHCFKGMIINCGVFVPGASSFGMQGLCPNKNRRHVPFATPSNSPGCWE